MVSYVDYDVFTSTFRGSLDGLDGLDSLERWSKLSKQPKVSKPAIISRLTNMRQLMQKQVCDTSIALR